MKNEAVACPACSFLVRIPPDKELTVLCERVRLLEEALQFIASALPADECQRLARAALDAAKLSWLQNTLAKLIEDTRREDDLQPELGGRQPGEEG